MGGENTNNAPRTLKDIKDAEENEEGNQEDKPQEWYAGGASSGQNVIDPSKRPSQKTATAMSSRTVDTETCFERR
jgi:hypothetical protein